MNRIDLKGRNAIVTGAARGLGLAISQKLLESGANVSMWDLDKATLDMAVRKLNAVDRVHAAAADVSNEQAVMAAVDDAMATFGRIDILVNNAGIAGPVKRSWEYSLDEWRRVMAVNVDGVYIVTRAVLPHMLTQKYGRIVNLASIAGKNGSPYFAPYSTSKAAVIGLTKSMGKDLAQTGIVINCIAPTGLETDMVRGFDPSLVKSMVDQTPMGRLANAAELSAMVAWMASEECSFTTGAVFDLSGGRATY
jgi:3-oxoacyl-[acyl-carrier protein] reductase